jgi:hypothetical protein
MARAKRSSLKQIAEFRLYCRNNEEAIPHFHSVLNLTDVVFTSLDIEGRRTTSNSRIGKFWVSILDTRQLVEKSELVSSRHICTRYRGKSTIYLIAGLPLIFSLSLYHAFIYSPSYYVHLLDPSFVEGTTGAKSSVTSEQTVEVGKKDFDAPHMTILYL